MLLNAEYQTPLINELLYLFLSHREDILQTARGSPYNPLNIFSSTKHCINILMNWTNKLIVGRVCYVIFS